jgi:hypothetical protein
MLVERRNYPYVFSIGNNITKFWSYEEAIKECDKKKSRRQVLHDHVRQLINILHYFSGFCDVYDICQIFSNPLDAKLNPICPLLALFGAHHILHVS